MAAGADADPQPLAAGELHAGHDVLHADRLQDGGGPPRLTPLVEHSADGGLLEAGLAAAEEATLEHAALPRHTTTDWPPSTTMSTALR